MPYAGFEKATNCLLEVPQNIKMTLENNVLTLKAGSVLTDGGNVYTTSTTAEDKTRDLSSLKNGKYAIFSAFLGGAIQTPHLVSKISSGDTLPTISSSIEVFYLTTDKTFHLRRNTQEEFESDWAVAYPLCVIKVNDGVASFAKDSNGNDMIFNGAGFIGHHAFVYPGVEWLAANGTLNSVIVKNSAFQIIQLYNYHNAIFGYTETIVASRTDIGEYASYNELPTSNLPVNPVAYLKDENVMCYFSSDGWKRYPGQYVKIVDFNYDGTNVIDFTIQQPLTKYRWVVKLIP